MARRRTPLPLLAALALAALALGVPACGESGEHTEVVEGEAVELGDLTYSAVFSRYLNPADPEDSAYVVGQPPPPADAEYFGVFFEVENEGEESQRLAGEMTIHDTDDRAYEALPSESLYAFPFGEMLGPDEQVPRLDSTAQQGPIEGALALFLLPAEAAQSRPLILEIPGPGGPAEVELDL